MMPMTLEQAPSLQDLLNGASSRLGINQYVKGAGLPRPLKSLYITRFKNLTELFLSSRPEMICILPSCAFPLNKGEQIFPLSLSRKFLKARPSKSACIAIAGAKKIPDFLIHAVSNADTHLFSSIYDEYLLESRLTGLFREKIEGETSLSGGLISLHGSGILILGEHGSGKTTCALELVKRGYHWVADDVVFAKRKNDGFIYGRSWKSDFPLLEIKDRGIVRVQDVLIPSAIEEESKIDFFVELVQGTGTDQGKEGDNPLKILDILETPIPGISLPVSGDLLTMATQLDHSIQTFRCMRKEQ
ncbi:Hpr(Ser) kinase/phosphatase [Syntrophus gentianae]|uniref:Hpr(Ser) kinase/phosphatase n=2 Tax=Syntrophus gentianae TaxID=43775 RepID=A0A1H7WZ81_9BACT|nr:Hpr(Ser) kinase/phosphatase [Syntrophus gentianae]